MAKRGPEDQLTKDDYKSDGEGSEDPGVREEELRPVAGRQIRGLPKRKGLGSAPSAPAASGFSFGSTAAAPAAPVASASTSGFSFGSTSSATPSSSSNPFSFGSTSATPAETSKPAAFSFGSSGASNGSGSGGFSVGSTPATSSASQEPAPKASSSAPFGGFAFGSKPAEPASTSAPAPSKPAAFSFGTSSSSATTSEPAKETAAPKAAFGGFSFGSKAAELPKEAPKTEAPKADPPKAFGGFSFGKSAATSAAPVSSSSQSSASQHAPKASSSPIAGPAASSIRRTSQPAPSQSTPPSTSEVSYYTSLRGLNTSFLTFLSQQLNGNEFLDLRTVLPSLLSQYETHLREASTKAGWQPPPPTIEEEAETNGSAQPAASTSKQAASEPTPRPQPTAEKSVAPASAPRPSSPKKSSSSVNKIVEEALDEDDAMTGTQSTQESAKEAAKAAEPPKFSFGSSSKSSGLFSFAPSGPLHPTTPDSKSFTPSATTTSPSEPPPKLGKFGPDGTTPQLSFGGAKSAAPGTPGPSASKGGFSFGTPSASSSSSTGFAFGGASKGDKPAFSFGGAPADKSADKPAETAPKPTFSFGGSSAAPAASSAKPFSFGSTSTPSFSFGGTPASSAPASTAPSGTATPAEGTSDQQAEDGEPSKNLALTAGAGEENEDTVIDQRGKLYALTDGKFDVVGLGQFKLKRGKEDGKRRLLMRTEGSGNIILNMAVQSTFKANQREANVTFVGIDLTGNVKSYMLRVKTKDMAKDVVDSLNKEVAAIN